MCVHTEVDESKAALADDLPQPPALLVGVSQGEAFREGFGQGPLLRWCHGD